MEKCGCIFDETILYILSWEDSLYMKKQETLQKA